MQPNSESLFEKIHEIIKSEVGPSKPPVIKIKKTGHENQWIFVSFDENKANFPSQGWKLHVSATHKSAEKILKACVPELIRKKCQFKVASNFKWLKIGEHEPQQRSQVGKFITIYPKSNTEAIEVGNILAKKTLGLAGPCVPSDLRLQQGSPIYYRYGAFYSHTIINECGQIVHCIKTPEGKLVPDERKPYFHKPEWLQDPFRNGESSLASFEQGPIGTKYEVKSAVSQKAKGGLYLAVSTIDNQPYIIKEARAHLSVDEHNRDARDRLKNEESIIKKITHTQLAPKIIDAFEQENNYYVVFEKIPGTTLRNFVMKILAEGNLLATREVINFSSQILKNLIELHKLQILFRDLTPNNCIVTPDNKLFFIDFELGYTPNHNPHFLGFTLGYSPPEQQRGFQPSDSDDLYGFGSILFFLLTGRDPLVSKSDFTFKKLREQLYIIRPDTPSELVDIICQCRHTNKEKRFNSPQKVLEKIENIRFNKALKLKIDKVDFFEQAVRTGDYLCAQTKTPNKSNPPWEYAHSYAKQTLTTNIHYGVSGTALFLADLYTKTNSKKHLDSAETTAAWALEYTLSRRNLIPNLYFGDAGVAWLLAKLSKVTKNTTYLNHACDLAEKMSSTSKLPDIVHGAAGQGLLMLGLEKLSSIDFFLQLAKNIGDSLSQTAHAIKDGIIWYFPQNCPADFKGKTFYGFAHGSAGTAYFLLELYQRTKEEKYLDIALSAANHLLKVAKISPDEKYMNWPNGANDERTMSYWCNGASGIGQFFTKAYQVTQNKTYLAAARAAANTVIRNSHIFSPVQCHGIAGNGDLLIDLYNQTNDRFYLENAMKFGRLLTAMGVKKENTLLWPSEDYSTLTPSLMTGYSGVAAFLLRLSFPKMPRILTLAQLTED